MNKHFPHLLSERKRLQLLLFLFFITFIHTKAEDYQFYFGEGDKNGFVKITDQTLFGMDSPFGYDLNSAPVGNKPFFFSISLPEGNYRVTVVLGNTKEDTHTTIRSESRRLMLENVETAAGETVTRSFTVNIRNKMMGENDSVRIKPREKGKLNWDDKLTLEINGKRAGLQELTISEVDIPTLFLAGNSTVTDQEHEPWCGWGQILPRFLNSQIAVANYAESGEAANTFIFARRFAKIGTKMRKGDFLLIEFGHNDQKQQGADRGPYTSYKKSLKDLIDATREKGATPILVTPMHRRNFDEKGNIINTLGAYPDAVRQLAREEKVMLIDLNKMSKTLYEAWGPEESKKAFVHYPAGTFPGQSEALADNTHFNSYGGYQLSKCIIQGLIDNNTHWKKYIVKDYTLFNPAQPDDPDRFFISPTPFYTESKPEGN